MAYFENRNVFDSCVESSQYLCMDNIPLETSVRCLSENLVGFKIEVGVYEKFGKM